MVTRSHLFDNLSNFLIGFDNLVHQTHSTYPPYNVVKDGEDYHIQVAVAGFEPPELSVEVVDGTLTVSGVRSPQEKDNSTYVHRGIASRSWTHRWKLNDSLEVATPHLAHGILSIPIKSVINTSKPRKLEILT